ncbi:MAG: hypothetical protein EPO08_12525 [Rhodospirillaceae bacterium]|nr:MAG: hypothetical protein EPO08_12525 [Rhodospirillaceae bacterium]
MHFAIEAVGWAGGLVILIAYGLLSAGHLSGRSVIYQSMNIVGSAGFVINSGWNGAIPSAALNVIWMVIGIYTLIKLRASGRQPHG